MKYLACDVDGEIVSPDECRDCATRRLLRQDPDGKMRHCQNPTPVIFFLTRKDESRKNAGISTTNIASKCLRKIMWEKTRDHLVLVGSQWAAGHGTLVHEGLEKYVEPGVIAETRLAKVMPRSGRKITGQIDRYVIELGRIEDYKIKDKPMWQIPYDYIVQQNIYAWMIRTGCAVHETGEVVKGQVNSISLYVGTHKNWQEVVLPIWSDEKVENYIELTLDVLERVNDPTYIPPRGMNPEREPLCIGFCPFRAHCLNVGGPNGHPALGGIRD